MAWKRQSTTKDFKSAFGHPQLAMRGSGLALGTVFPDREVTIVQIDIGLPEGHHLFRPRALLKHNGHHIEKVHTHLFGRRKILCLLLRRQNVHGFRLLFCWDLHLRVVSSAKWIAVNPAVFACKLKEFTHQKKLLVQRVVVNSVLTAPNFESLKFGGSNIPQPNPELSEIELEGRQQCLGP